MLYFRKFKKILKFLTISDFPHGEEKEKIKKLTQKLNRLKVSKSINVIHNYVFVGFELYL